MKIEQITTRTHEKVLYCEDAASGLRSFIALHDTRLGPGLGGCRMWDYATTEEALADVLRLSAGMTAKSAVAGLPFGGGKAVIIGDSRHDKTPELLRAFGRFVNTLKGEFITGEDVGMSPEDMAIAATETKFISGLPTGPVASGDPSPVTAEGVFRCMKVAAGFIFGSEQLSGCRVSVQGLGHVGMALAERLHDAGAALSVADVNREAVEQAVQRFGAKVLSPEAIVTTEAEIFAPCALGGVLDRRSGASLRSRIVCGSANNQIATDECANLLHARGVLYCPDYVVNSGGLINVASEALAIKNQDWVEQRLVAAVETFREMLHRSVREGRSPLEVADETVKDILASAESERRLKDAG